MVKLLQAQFELAAEIYLVKFTVAYCSAFNFFSPILPGGFAPNASPAGLPWDPVPKQTHHH